MVRLTGVWQNLLVATGRIKTYFWNKVTQATITWLSASPLLLSSATYATQLLSDGSHCFIHTPNYTQRAVSCWLTGEVWNNLPCTNACNPSLHGTELCVGLEKCYGHALNSSGMLSLCYCSVSYDLKSSSGYVL